MADGYALPTEHSDTVKDVICSNRLIFEKIGQELFENPELAFVEVKARKLLTCILKEEGFSIVDNPSELPTSFVAEYGSGGNTVILICEYDAPSLKGHTCGTHLISEASIAAAFAVKAAIDSYSISGKIKVIGAPGKENCHKGKIKLMELGFFDSADAVMLAQPSKVSIAAPKKLGMNDVRVTFGSKGGSQFEAAVSKELDTMTAALACYGNISRWKEYIKVNDRVVGIIERGGDTSREKSESSVLFYHLCSTNPKSIAKLQDGVKVCFDAAARATSCEVDYTFGDEYIAPLNSNTALADAFRRLGQKEGMVFQDGVKGAPHFMEATDLGNISLKYSSIMPTYRIHSKTYNHSPGFLKFNNTQKAHDATLRAAVVLALTTLEVFQNPNLLADMQVFLSAGPIEEEEDEPPEVPDVDLGIDLPPDDQGPDGEAAEPQVDEDQENVEAPEEEATETTEEVEATEEIEVEEKPSIESKLSRISKLSIRSLSRSPDKSKALLEPKSSVRFGKTSEATVSVINSIRSSLTRKKSSS